MATRTPAKKTAPKRSASPSALKKAPSSKTTRAAAAKPAAKKAEVAKPAAKKSSGKPLAEAVTLAEVQIDRRRKPRREEAAKAPAAAPLAAPAPKLERRAKVNRRRQIDPTTCERDYSGDEIEFMNALDEYKRRNGRMFPTCSEVLEVVRSLGYAKAALAGGNLVATADATPNQSEAMADDVAMID